MTISSLWCNQITINHLPACLLTFLQLTDLPPWHEHAAARLVFTLLKDQTSHLIQSVASAGQSAPKFPSTALTFAASAEREREMFVLSLMSVKEQRESWQSAASLRLNYMSALSQSCRLFMIWDQFMSKVHVAFRCRCCPEVTGRHSDALKSLRQNKDSSHVNLRDDTTVSC